MKAHQMFPIAVNIRAATKRVCALCIPILRVFLSFIKWTLMCFRQRACGAKFTRTFNDASETSLAVNLAFICPHIYTASGV